MPRSFTFGTLKILSLLSLYFFLSHTHIYTYHDSSHDLYHPTLQETGEIVRTTTYDTDAAALYETMKKTLVYLTHLNWKNTESIMTGKLSRQVRALIIELSCAHGSTRVWWQIH